MVPPSVYCGSGVLAGDTVRSCVRKALELVIDSLDGSGCACIALGGGGAVSVGNMALDDVYDLAFIETLGNGNDLYRTVGVSSACRMNFYFLGPPCVDPPSVFTGHAARFVVEIDPATIEVKRIQSESHLVNTGGGAQPPYEDGNLFKWNGTAALDTAQSNQSTCTLEAYAQPGSGQKPPATGGTGRVRYKA